MNITQKILIKALHGLIYGVSLLITFLLGAIMKLSLSAPELYAGYAAAFIAAVLFFIWASKQACNLEQKFRHGTDK